MNRRIILTLVAGLLVFAGGCNEERPRENNYKATTVAANADSTLTVNYDSLLTVLTMLQDSIRLKPSRKTTVDHLLQVSYDSLAGTFKVVGKGVANPEHPEAARAAGQKVAAGYDGKRWSLFCKAWFTGESRAFGSPINGEVAYSTTLFVKALGDTLFMLLEVPLGSIVVR